jgi:apolipoprotein N-acyltransferase
VSPLAESRIIAGTAALLSKSTAGEPLSVDLAHPTRAARGLRKVGVALRGEPLTAWRPALAILLAGASGLLLAVAFPPYDLWPLVWLAFVPVALGEARLLPPRLAGLGAGIAAFAFVAIYARDITTLPGTPLLIRAIPLSSGLLAFAAARSTRGLRARLGPVRSGLFIAFGWVGLELARSFVPITGTWAFVAYTLWQQPWLIQPVSVVGVYGLGLFILLVNVAATLLGLSILDRFVPALHTRAGIEPLPARLAARTLAGTAVLVAAWVGTSLSLLDAPPATLRVAALQPGLHRPMSRDEPEEARAQMLQRLTEQTREAAARGARVIVWPEAALAFDPRVTSAGIDALARETGAYLFVGYGVDTPSGLRNEVTAVAPDGRFLGVTSKDHPVVGYGETSASHARDFVYQTPLGALGNIICFDLDFIDTSRRVAAAGARVIAVPSWDWAGAARKHYTQLVFRAVETRAVMIKSEQAFDSAIIDPWGRVVASSVSTEPRRAVLVADVPLVAGPPPCVALGDLVGWLCALGAASLAVAGGRRSLSRRRSAPAGIASGPSTPSTRTSDSSCRSGPTGSAASGSRRR